VEGYQCLSNALPVDLMSRLEFLNDMNHKCQENDPYNRISCWKVLQSFTQQMAILFETFQDFKYLQWK
jgi:hypothetical protein